MQDAQSYRFLGPQNGLRHLLCGWSFRQNPDAARWQKRNRKSTRRATPTWLLNTIVHRAFADESRGRTQSPMNRRRRRSPMTNGLTTNWVGDVRVLAEHIFFFLQFVSLSWLWPNADTPRRLVAELQLSKSESSVSEKQWVMRQTWSPCSIHL